MNTTDYLTNGIFIVVVLFQARERRLDTRSLVIPLAVLYFVAQQYLHSIPTAGNDLTLIVALASAGMALGTACGLATHVRIDADGMALARVGWLAGALLIGGISSRMVFAFAISHGAEPAIRSFSIAHQIGAAAWPVALVSMAICEVTTRLVSVQLRAGRLTAAHVPTTVEVGEAA